VHDEVATFFHYIHKGEFLPYFAHWDANNHILNSALATLSYNLFGATSFALRLPNLIALPIYLFFCCKISKAISHPILKWAFLLSLCLMHNFIEYFALARGYGMSMALLFGSIWHLMNYLKHQKTKYVTFSLTFIILGTLANLTLFNSFLVILCILIASFIINYRNLNTNHKISSVLLILGMGIIPLIFFSRLLLKMKEIGALYYGTSEGFWDLTLKSLTKLIFNTEHPVIAITIAVIFIIIIAISIGYILKNRDLKRLLNFKLVFFYLLAGNLVIVLLLGYFFNVNYPEDRTGLYFIPLFIGSLIFSIDLIIKRLNSKIVYLVALPFLIFPVHFLFSMNLNYSSFWKHERIPARFHQKIINDTSNAYLNTIGGYQIRRLCWAFYNFKSDKKSDQVHCSSYPEAFSDYQIVDIDECQLWPKYYDSIDYDPYSRLYLLKRKNMVKRIPLKKVGPIVKEKTHNEFYNLFQSSTDSLIGKSLIVSLNLSITSEEEPFYSRAVASVHSKDGENICYEYIALDWMRTGWNGEKDNFKGNLTISKIPRKASVLKVYIWNINKTSYSISDGQCIINEFCAKNDSINIQCN
jgi:hypothetical protein